MSNLDPISAPYGPTAPATDFQVFANPGSDQAVAGRGFIVLATGNVVVTTEQGNDRTITGAAAGLMVACSITTVKAATTATVLVYTD